MKVCVLYYDGFCEFEVVFAFARFRGSVYSTALDQRVYLSEEQQKFVPDLTIEELNPEDIDLFIIPGGQPSSLYENERLRSFITALNSKNKYIAGISGGTRLMAKYGILEGKKCTGGTTGIILDKPTKELFKKSMIVSEDVVRDGNCITSTGQAYIEFSIELGKLMNAYKDDEEIKDEYNWLKNIKFVE